MADNENIKKLIIAHERKFSAQLCVFILQKPRLSSWMIFIPFIFVFYIQDFLKYKNGKQAFMENFISTRNKALDEAEAALAGQRSIDTGVIAHQAELSTEAREKYAEFMAVLAEHYSALLQATGETYEELLKSAYGRSKKNYLAYIEQLGKAEKVLNKALRPGLEESTENVEDVVGSIERYSEKIRMANAKEFFA
jgi:hypothetical protein